MSGVGHPPQHKAAFRSLRKFNKGPQSAVMKKKKEEGEEKIWSHGHSHFKSMLATYCR